MKICTGCNKDISGTAGKVCRSCRWKASKKKCLDCETLIGRDALRCRPCDGKAKMFERHPNWTGGRKKHSQGYVLLTDQESKNHPNSQKGGLLEHIKVMSDLLGRPLDTKVENVHHKNGVKDDNRVENLELWTISQPRGQRVTDKIAWAKEILALYGDDPSTYLT